MQKLKTENLLKLIGIIKACLIGIIATILATIFFAFVLKFVDLSTKVISYINDLIKVGSIFLTIAIIKKKNSNKLLIQAIFSAVIYAFLVHVIFSIFNGSFLFGLDFIYNLLFCVIVSVISSIILNVLNSKTM